MKELVEFVERNGLFGDFAGPQSEVAIQQAEEILGVVFPESYRQFLAVLGSGSIGGSDFYGLSSVPLMERRVPNVVGLTLLAREQASLPEDMLVVGNKGMFLRFVLDLSESADSPRVAVWDEDEPFGESNPEFFATDFASFALRRAGLGLLARRDNASLELKRPGSVLELPRVLKVRLKSGTEFAVRASDTMVEGEDRLLVIASSEEPGYFEVARIPEATVELVTPDPTSSMGQDVPVGKPIELSPLADRWRVEFRSGEVMTVTAVGASDHGDELRLDLLASSDRKFGLTVVAVAGEMVQDWTSFDVYEDPSDRVRHAPARVVEYRSSRLENLHAVVLADSDLEPTWRLKIQQPVVADEFGADETDDRYLVRTPTGASIDECLVSIDLSRAALTLEFSETDARFVGLTETDTLSIPLELSAADLDYLAKSVRQVLAIPPVPPMTGLL